MAIKKSQIEKWIVAQKKHRLSDTHVQMARELGLNPDKLQQKPERMSRTDQPNNLCRGRLSLFLFPLCISLAVFIITTFFLCIDELS